MGDLAHKKRAWPKGPFPEKWSFASVAQRLEGAWDARAEAWDALIASGARRLDPLDDPYVRAFEGGSPEAIAALARCCTVLGWAAPGAQVIAGAQVALPTTDPLDALVAVGTAGPHHGIGSRTLIRFLVQARALATLRPVTVGEDLLVLEIQAKGPEAAALIAERLPHVAPGLAGRDLAGALEAGTTLALDYAPR